MDDKTWLIIYVVIGWLTAIVFEIQCTRWRKKHDEAITAWIIESNNKDKQILKLQEELENLKGKSMKHGKWLPKIEDDIYEFSECSECGNMESCETPYCAQCGARMDGVVE